MRTCEQRHFGMTPSGIWIIRIFLLSCARICTCHRKTWTARFDISNRKVFPGTSQNVLPIILRGVPNASDATNECFPASLRASRVDFGNRNLPTLIDATREECLLHAVSFLLQSKYSVLNDRYQQFKRRQLRRMVVGAAVISGIFLALTCWAMFSQHVATSKQAEAQAARVVAEDRRRESGERLANLYVDMAFNRTGFATGDVPFSIPWLSGALQEANESGADTAIHLARLTNAIRSSNLPAQIIRLQKTIATSATSPDGKWLAIGFENGTIQVCRLDSPTSLTKELHVKGNVRKLAFSGDGLTLAVATSQLAKAASFQERQAGGKWGVELLQTRGNGGADMICEVEDAISVLTFSHDGKRLLVATGEDVTERLYIPSPEDPNAATRTLGRAYLWDVSTQTQIGKSLDEQEMILSAVFSPDGTQVALGTAGFIFSNDTKQGPEVTEQGYTRVWDVQHSQPVSPKLYAGNGFSVYALEFHDKVNLQAIAGNRQIDKGEIRNWRLTDWTELSPAASISFCATGIAYSVDGARAVIFGNPIFGSGHSQCGDIITTIHWQ